MTATRTLFLLLGAGLLAACDSDPVGTVDNGPVIDCGPEVTSVNVTVSAGLTPTIDWSPRCRVTLLLIEEGAHDVWSPRGREDHNDVAPPITYGITPSGLTGGPAEPLVAGHTYEVILWHAGESDRVLGIHEFSR
jgi:hypothetical protein